MQLHPYHQAIIDANRAANRPYFHQLNASDARELLRAAIAAAPPPQDLPALASVEDREFDGADGPIPVRVYDPLGSPWGTVVFFHGGGWVIGDLDQVDNTCRRFARPGPVPHRQRRLPAGARASLSGAARGLLGRA